jgi:hypothetical protein
MKIPHLILTYNSSHNEQARWKQTATERENDIILLLSFLHFYKKINDDRLKSMFRALKSGTLLRKINTHHCKINDTWYNDESMYFILMECYLDLCPKEDMPLEVFLKYLNLYLNKNRNFCIDAVYFQFIEPFIETVENYPSDKIIKSFDVGEIGAVNFEEVDNNNSLDGGYCCEDCDGCYERYKQSRYEYYYRDNIKKDLKAKFKSILLNQKTSSCYKNPNERLSK